MTNRGDGARRPLLGAMLKWFLVLLIPFGVMLLEGWMHLRVLHNDYAQGRLRVQINEAREQVTQLRLEQAKLEAMGRLALKASELGLVKPEPNQIEEIGRNSLYDLRETPPYDHLARLPRHDQALAPVRRD